MHKLFRKKPALWYVLRPGRPGTAYAKEGPYDRATVAKMQRDGQLGEGALLWTNERIFANADRPNSSRYVRCDKWLRWDELPDPTQAEILATPPSAHSGAGLSVPPAAPGGAPAEYDETPPPIPHAPPPHGGPGGGGHVPVQLVAEYPRPINQAAPPQEFVNPAPPPQPQVYAPPPPAAPPAQSYAPPPPAQGYAPPPPASGYAAPPPGYPAPAPGPAYGAQPSHPAYPQPRQ